MGNRMSILDQTLYCGLAGKLASQYGAGRAAAQSSAFHARMSNYPGWEKLWAQLTEEERQEAESWSKPTPVYIGHSDTFPDGYLRYEHATKESEVHILEDMSGSRVEKRRSDIASTGHPDMFWHVSSAEEGMRTVYVGDAKRTRFTSTTESLQLHAYGWALADEFEATHYQLGIWILDESEWVWGKPVDVYSDTATLMADQLEVAINNLNDVGTTGAHCSSCYARSHCPEFLLPGAELLRAPADAISLLTQPGGITRDNQLEVLQAYQAAKEIVAAMKGALETSVEELGPIQQGAKEWRQVRAGKGRVSFDTKAFEADNPEIYQRYVKTGAPHSMGYRWCNAKGAK